jgi:predicted nucleic acid-binding protein
VILLDTSALLAALIPDQPRHAECAQALDEAHPPRIISPFIVAEMDYLIQRFAGVEGELAFLHELGASTYQLAPFVATDVVAARGVIERYRSLGIGLADASIVVLAERYSTYDILTLDERHFRAVRPLTGRRGFRLLPADA